MIQFLFVAFAIVSTSLKIVESLPSVVDDTTTSGVSKSHHRSSLFKRMEEESTNTKLTGDSALLAEEVYPQIPRFDDNELKNILPPFCINENRAEKILFYLSGTNVDIRSVTDTRMTLLNVAASIEDSPEILASAKALIESIEDDEERIKFINQFDMEGFTPLHTAITHSNDLFAAMLIQKGAVFNYEIINLLSVAKNLPGELKFNQWLEVFFDEPLNEGSLLFDAIRQEMLETVKEMMKQGAVLTSEEKEFLESKLYDESMGENHKLLRILHLAGIGKRINHLGIEMSFLELALHRKEPDLFIELIEDGAIFNEEEKERLRNQKHLFVASLKENTAFFRALIKAGADINMLYDSETVLHWTAYNGKLELTNLLVSLGANLDIVNEDGKTPLYLAVEQNHLDVVKYLISANAEVNVKDTGHEKSTPLIQAASKGYNEIVFALIEAHANVNEKEDEYNQYSALHYAVDLRNLDILEMLIDAHVDLDVQTGESPRNTALHIAVDKRDLPCVKRLVKAGAGKNILNADELTPLHIARIKNYVEIIQILDR